MTLIHDLERERERERERQTDRQRQRFCEIEAHCLVNCPNNISKNLNFEMEAR